MYEFAKSMGMEVLVAGKGKNNALKVSANPDTSFAGYKDFHPHTFGKFIHLNGCSRFIAI
jgi:predicted homoserine dehydrogenase-like protein